MITGAELEAKVAELKEAGYDNKTIIETIVNEDFEVGAGELSKILGVTPLDVGRVKGAIRRKRQPPREGGEGGVPTDWLSQQPPMAQRLYEALARVMPKSLDKAKAITDIFARNIAQFQNRHMFRSWLSRYGLPADSMAQVEDELYGFEVGGMPSGQFGTGQPGQPTIAYVPQPGGGVTPLIVMNPPSPAPQWPGGNITFTMPPQPPESKPSPEVEMLRGEVKTLKDSFKELGRQISDLTYMIRTPPPSSSQPRTRRRPMLDDEGKIMRDADGNILYEEIPYDEKQSELEYMKTIAAISSRRESGGITTDAIRNIITDELSKKEVEQQRFKELEDRIMSEIDRRFPGRGGGEGRGITAEDVRSVIKEEFERRERPEMESKYQELRERIDNIMREQEMAEQTRRVISEQIDPILRKMEVLETATQRAGLTSESAKLVHAETMANNWQEFFLRMGHMLGQDFKVGMLSAIIPQLRAGGVSDDLISDIIRAAGGIESGPPEIRSKPSGLREKAEEFTRKYVKPEGAA